MGLMNGNPYYSAPTRHTRCLGDRFIDPVIPGEPASLEEMPFLVARAIRDGLIKLPNQVAEEPVRSKKPIAPWQRIICIGCKQPFVRSQRRHHECARCRVPQRSCTVCKTVFRPEPEDRKQQCCSRECVLKSSKFARMEKLNRPTHTCTVCGKEFEGRLSGAGWAKTCDSACANEARARYHAERRSLRIAAKEVKE